MSVMCPKVVDVFCGAGGLTRGFAEAAFDVVAGIDLDPAAAYAYGANNDSEFILADVATVSGKLLDDLFLGASHRILAGCAPCQAFSTYTQGLAKPDDRWQLLREFSRLIQETMPEIVTMENVPRLRAHSQFQDFLAVLFLCGYHIWCDVVPCSWFGVPQTRKRLVLLASRLGPIHLLTPSSRSNCSLSDSIAHLPPIQAGETCRTDPLHRAAALTAKNLARLKASKPGGTWRDWPDQLRARCHRTDIKMSYVSVYGRMEWDKPAPTITTEFYGVGHGRFGHPDQDRAISLREGAMLQTFPQAYSFARGERIPMAHAGRLIGNAVPVGLARGIAVSIREHLETHHELPV
jgi:DNA (cytosine-5)-methyltransferase 1